MRINAKVCSLLLILTTFENSSAEDPDYSTRLEKKPNILVLFADDVGTGDVPGYFQRSGIVDMPNLQKLVDEGVTFTDAHSTPLCAPSRYVFLSGNYQHRGQRYPGLWNLNYKMNQFKPGQLSLPSILQDNGYDTGIFGKWHLGGKIPTESNFKSGKFYASKNSLLKESGHDWSKPIEQGPWDIGFKTSVITTGGIQSPPYAFFRNGMLDVEMDEIVTWTTGNYSMSEGVSYIKTDGEGTIEWDSSAYNMIVANETLSYIETLQEEEPDKPFFAYLAMSAVHIPNSPPDTFLDGSPVAGQYQNNHLDALLELDKIVGHMSNSLDELGLLEDTIILFTSDNGGLNGLTTFSDQYGHYSNGPLRGSKGEIYEGGIRVPFTIKWEGGKIPKGEKRSNLIGLNDIFRTICGLVGINVPQGQAVDSKDFSRYIYNEKSTYGLRKYLGAWVYFDSRLQFESMRYNEMKLVRSYQNSTAELFNLTADPSETRDVSSQHSDLVVKMFQRIRIDGPCHDKGGHFRVKTERKARTFRYISCYWIRQKRTEKRCAKFPEAENHCHYSCAGRNKQYCAKDAYDDQKLFKIFTNTY